MTKPSRLHVQAGIGELMVHTAFPGEEAEGETVALVKDHGRWRFLDARKDTIIE